MQHKVNCKFLALYLILGVVFVAPALSSALAKEFNLANIKQQLKIAKDISQLNLGLEKEKALLDLEQKYGRERRSCLANLKQYQEDLKASLSGPAQDEAKIKTLVNAIGTTQDKLLAVVKMERDEAMHLMTPVQQGQFLVMLGNWYEEFLQKSEKKKS